LRVTTFIKEFLWWWWLKTRNGCDTLTAPSIYRYCQWTDSALRIVVKLVNERQISCWLTRP